MSTLPTHVLKTDPTWLAKALGELGVREVPGDKDNPRIIQYHAATTLRATSDEVPWCSSFVNWAMMAVGYVPTRSAAARSWATWGQAVPLQRGAIVVLSRGKSSASGHVGFLLHSDANGLWILGGNQGNAVSVMSFPHARLIACRGPKLLSGADAGKIYTMAV